MSDTTLADRALLRVSGVGTRDFLQGLLTQDIAAVTPGAPQWAALLGPQGKVLFDMILWDAGDPGGEAILIDAEAARTEALARRLAIYRLRRPITIEPVADVAVHWSPTSEQGSPDSRLPALGRRWLGTPGDGDASPAWLAHRLGLGVTEGVGELGDGDTLWLECNARELRGVSFTKGCYIGQENTARMHHRSKVNRRLVVAPLADPGDRTRATYPDLGLMVEHRRVEALGNAIIPSWLANALAD